ncbi:MAG: hypothetical protein ACP5IB_07745 [Thermoplasmata archaeon]
MIPQETETIDTELFIYLPDQNFQNLTKEEKLLLLHHYRSILKQEIMSKTITIKNKNKNMQFGYILNFDINDLIYRKEFIINRNNIIFKIVSYKFKEGRFFTVNNGSKYKVVYHEYNFIPLSFKMHEARIPHSIIDRILFDNKFVYGGFQLFSY